MVLKPLLQLFVQFLQGRHTLSSNFKRLGFYKPWFILDFCHKIPFSIYLYKCSTPLIASFNEAISSYICGLCTLSNLSLRIYLLYSLPKNLEKRSFSNE